MTEPTELNHPLESTTASTLHLLTTRLHRLTYLLSGDTAWSGTPIPPPKPASYEETVVKRLLELEEGLQRLSTAVPVVGEVLSIYNRFPDLFKGSPNLTTTTTKPTQQPTPTSPTADPSDPAPDNNQPHPQTQPSSEPEQSAHLDLTTLISQILAYAPTYPETASRLTALRDTPIPDAQASAALIALQPRIERLARMQDEQAGEIAALRVRTARVLERWVEVSVLGGGEVWGEWEGRLEGVERGVRRGEVLRGRS
ncbi:hypothetical protein BJX61DRAFT_540972 [Aspergillus egyptiacus]|nr:hypothetical protein BJX61DRAFT_540972 [Aspergillus egyptiacus]